MNSIQKIKEYITPELKEEISTVVKEFSHIVVPQILFYCCFYLQFSINLYFVSLKYHDSLVLNAVGIAHIYANVTSSVIFCGICGALDTLASNAYGSKNYKLIGVYFDRCRNISICFFVVIMVLHVMSAKWLLTLLQVDPKVIDITVQYVYVYVFAQLITTNFNMYAKLFVLIERAEFNLYISLGGIAVHTISCGMLTYVLGLGVIGGAISFTLVGLFNSAAATIVAHRLDLPSETFVYFTKEGLIGWAEYLYIAAPNIFLNLGEWVGYEVQGIICIFVSPVVYTTHVLVINYECLTFPYSFGISTAVSMKIGEKLMSYTSSNLKRLITIMYGFSFTFEMVVLFIVFLTARAYFYTISPDEIIATKCCESIPYVMFYVFFVNGYYVYMHTLKGMGYLVPPTIASFVNFYCIQISLSLVFVFWFHMEVRGIYLSMSIGAALAFALFAYWTYSKDLDEMKKNAEARVDRDNNKITLIEMKPMDSEENNNNDKNRIRLLDN